MYGTMLLLLGRSLYTGRSRGISMEQRLGELKRYVRGWMGYYGLASQLKLFASLEQCQCLFLQKAGQTHSVLLLETLATCSHAHPRVNGTRRLAPASHPTRHQSQGFF